MVADAPHPGLWRDLYVSTGTRKAPSGRKVNEIPKVVEQLGNFHCSQDLTEEEKSRMRKLLLSAMEYKEMYVAYSF